jgi:hypothetical protein
LSHFTLPGKDARDFTRALQGQKMRYSEVVVKLLELAPHGSTYFEVKKTLSSLPGKTLAFIGINQIVNDLTAAENGVVVFAASSGRRHSLENTNWNNGAFTKALVEGLNGKADYTQDGAVTINELDT